MLLRVPADRGSAPWRATSERFKVVDMRSKQIAGAVLVAGLAGLVAGCGGGGNSSTTTQSTHTTITKSATTSSSSGSSTSFASAQNCQNLAGLAAKAASAVAASGNSTNALQTESTELQALAQAAPSDIKGDFQTFAAAFAGFQHALQSSGYKLGSKTPPTAAQAAAFAKAAKSFATPKLKQAEQNLSAWAHQNCKGIGG
jgi:hypothetical protein